MPPINSLSPLVIGRDASTLSGMVSSKRSLPLIVIVVAVFVYLVGNGAVNLWDRDEPRYAQTSRQMLQSGDWVVPHYLDKVRTAKPVFIYWCQAGAMALIGDQGDAGVFAARLPSVIAMAAVLGLMAVAISRGAGPQRASWAVFVMASAVLAVWSAKACTTDAVLLVGIAVSQLCLYLIWRRAASWPVVIAMAVGIAEAGLTKGPVVLGVMAMTLAVLGVFRAIDARRAKKAGSASPLESAGVVSRSAPGNNLSLAKVIVAVAIVAALVTPWIYLVQNRESKFLGASVSHDVLNRIAQPLEGHTGPPGYHLALAFVTFFPWSLLLPLTLVSAWKNRADPQIRFALAAVIGPWLMFEIVRTKLPHYMLPTFPPLAFLTADAIVRCLRGEKDDFQKRSFSFGVSVIAFVLLAVGFAPLILTGGFGGSFAPPAIVAAVALAGTASMHHLFSRKKNSAGLVAMGLAIAAIYFAFFAAFLPRAAFFRTSSRVAEIMRRAGATGEGTSVMLDYKEPSLAFYQGGTIRENTKTALTHDMLDAAPEWLVVTAEVLAKTPADVRERLTIVGTVNGIAYSDGGRLVEVSVVRKR